MVDPPLGGEGDGLWARTGSGGAGGLCFVLSYRYGPISNSDLFFFRLREEFMEKLKKKTLLVLKKR